MAQLPSTQFFGIKSKFIIYYLLFLVGLVSLGVYISQNEQAMMTGNMRVTGERLTAVLAQASKGLMLQNQYLEITTYLKQVVDKGDDIISIAVLDEEGKIVADRQRGGGSTMGSIKQDAISARGKLASADFSETEPGTGYAIHCFVAPIREGATYIGQVQLRMSDEGLQKEIRKTTTLLAVVFLLALAACLFFYFFLSDSVIGPVMSLSEGARVMGGGNLDYEMGGALLHHRDEIGLLACSLNAMRENLKKSITILDRKIYEISILFSIAQAMNFIPDLSRLLNLILDNAIEALKGEHGSIMLVPEGQSEDVLEVFVVRGVELDTLNMKKTRIKRGEGIAGQVFETGEGIIANAGYFDNRFARHNEIEDREQRISNLLCVPMKVKDYSIGVINIVNKKDGSPFHDEDKRFLEAMSSQAALAIDKAKLYELSITDGMTKLFIHRYFQAKMDDELIRATRYNGPVSLILFDIDHFKKFNDSYGHQTGDVVIIHTAKIIRKMVREGLDIPARYGGEEFAVICPETNNEGALVLAERLRQAVEIYDYPGTDRPLKVTISLGIATFPEHGTNKKDLIKNADIALYRSKEKGRNATTTFSELQK